MFERASMGSRGGVEWVSEDPGRWTRLNRMIILRLCGDAVDSQYALMRDYP